MLVAVVPGVAIAYLVLLSFLSQPTALIHNLVWSTAAIAAGGIGSQTYTHDAEHEADLYAVQTMRINGVSTKPAAAALRRLQDWTSPLRRRPADEILKEDADAPVRKAPRFHIPEYLITHPDTDGRIDLFERDGAEPVMKR